MNKEILQPIENSKEVTREEWDAFYKKFEDLTYAVHDLIFSLPEDRKEYYFNKKEKQIRDSINSVENHRKYLTSHIVCGSSFSFQHTPKLDFEGNYSLLNYFENLKQEIEKEVNKKSD